MRNAFGDVVRPATLALLMLLLFIACFDAKAAGPRAQPTCPNGQCPVPSKAMPQAPVIRVYQAQPTQLLRYRSGPRYTKFTLRSRAAACTTGTCPNR